MKALKFTQHKDCFTAIIFALVIAFASCSKDQSDEKATNTIRTKITSINLFGNLVLDISDQDMTNAGFELGDMVRIKGSSLPKTIDMPYIDEYLVVGMWGASLNLFPDETVLTLALANSSFNDRIGGKIGDELTITMAEKGGFLDTYRNLDMTYTDNREEYASDEEFANFFCTKLGNIKEGKLYRSSKPLMGTDNNLRYKYADELAREAGVKTIVSFSDSEQDWLNALKTEKNIGEYTKELYQKSSLALHKIGADFFIPSNATKIGETMRYIRNSEPPYLICCSVGRDRTGLFSILIGILAGATYEELEADYMKSYYNYHHISKSDPRYKVLKSIILDRILYIISKQGDVDIAQMNAMNEIDVASFFSQLPQAVESYFTNMCGLTKTELDDVMSKLSI